MKATLLISIFAAASLGTGFATTTDQLEIKVGTLTATITDNGGCTGTGCSSLTFGGLDLDNSTDGQILTSGSNFGGWQISVTTGVSNSPGLVPYGLDISSLTATCEPVAPHNPPNPPNPCTSTPLEVVFSDQNFTTPVGINSFETDYSGNVTGNGSTSESAYFDNGNGLFAPTTLIGTAGPLNSSTSVGAATGGAIAATAPYSLTLDQIFNSGGQASSFSMDGDIITTTTTTTFSTPEPGALVLFGSVLVLCSTKLRRRRAS
jgi:hypothetical protein